MTCVTTPSLLIHTADEAAEASAITAHAEAVTASGEAIIIRVLIPLSILGHLLLLLMAALYPT